MSGTVSGVCRPLYYDSEARCLALIPRWTYDRETGECVEFSYGGCGGSSNNFESYEACSRKCGSRITRVTESPEPTSPDGKTLLAKVLFFFK